MRKRAVAATPTTVAGFAEHNGWAVVVCVRVAAGVPEVLDRRRIELIESGLPNQPYEHDTVGLAPAAAERLVEEVWESARICAERAISRLQAEVGALAAIALRTAPLERMPGSVAEVHASHHLRARADAMLFREALRLAAEGLGIRVAEFRKGTERSAVAKVLGIGESRVDAMLSGFRVTLGSPWQQDHQAAAARAIAAFPSAG